METSIENELRLINGIETLFAQYRDAVVKLTEAQTALSQMSPETHGESNVIAKGLEVNYFDFEVKDIEGWLTKCDHTVQRAALHTKANTNLVEEICISLRKCAGLALRFWDDNPSAVEVQLIMEHTQALIALVRTGHVRHISNEFNTVTTPLNTELIRMEVSV